MSGMARRDLPSTQSNDLETMRRKLLGEVGQLIDQLGTIGPRSTSDEYYKAGLIAEQIARRYGRLHALTGLLEQEEFARQRKQT